MDTLWRTAVMSDDDRNKFKTFDPQHHSPQECLALDANETELVRMTFRLYSTQLTEGPWQNGDDWLKRESIPHQGHQTWFDKLKNNVCGLLGFIDFKLARNKKIGLIKSLVMERSHSRFPDPLLQRL